jgi:hypothetical protein
MPQNAPKLICPNCLPKPKSLDLGVKHLVFVSSRSLKTRELSFAQFCNFLRKVCLFFNFWMIKFKIMSKNIIVNFIKKLKNKHTSLKKYTKVCLFFNFWMTKYAFMSKKRIYMTWPTFESTRKLSADAKPKWHVTWPTILTFTVSQWLVCSIWVQKVVGHKFFILLRNSNENRTICSKKKNFLMK